MAQAKRGADICDPVSLRCAFRTQPVIDRCDPDFDVVFLRPFMREVEESHTIPPAGHSDPNWPACPLGVHFPIKPFGKIAFFAAHLSGKSATASAPGFQIRLLHRASCAGVPLANLSQR